MPARIAGQHGTSTMTSMIAAAQLNTRHGRDATPGLGSYLVRSAVTLGGLVLLYFLAGI